MFLIRHRCLYSEPCAPVILCKQFLVFLRCTQLPEQISVFDDRILTETYFFFFFPLYFVSSNQNKIYDYGHRRMYIFIRETNRLEYIYQSLLDYTVTVENDDFISNQAAISIVQIIIS